MAETALVFAGVAVLFALFLLIRVSGGGRFCVLCASVSAAWAALLVLYWRGAFHSPELIALLMGGSAVGIHHFVEGRVGEQHAVFRLPLLLTLFFVAYLPFADLNPGLIWGASVIASLWVLFGIVHVFRHNERLRAMAAHIIRCCREW